jgi:thymidylate synthase
MNKLDLDYQALLQDILDNGVEKKDRTGTETISVFGRQIRHNMKDGFPLLTTKKMPFKTIVTELLWFLRGDTNIKYLVDNGCNIWNGDAYKNYVDTVDKMWLKSGIGDLDDMIYDRLLLVVGDEIRLLTQEEFIYTIKLDNEFAKRWGDLGPIYGNQWRNWKGFRHGWHDVAKVIDGSTEPHIDWLNGIDQITSLINDLKTNPDSRRLMVNAWNVGELDQMVLPPCHYGFQVYTRELSHKERFTIHSNNPIAIQAALDNKPLTEEETNTPTRAISLMWNQRSVDTFLGLPFNIASYGLLLEIIAKEVNMVPDELIGNLGDVHLYSNHIEQAKEQIGRHYTIEERVQLIPEGVLSQESVEYFNLNKRTNSEINVALAKYNISPGLHTRRPFPLPILNINTEFWKTQSGECGVGPLDTNLQGFEISDFEIVNYQSHPTIKAPLSN